MAVGAYVELDGVSYRVNDTQFSRGMTKRVPLGDPTGSDLSAEINGR